MSKRNVLLYNSWPKSLCLIIFLRIHFSESYFIYMLYIKIRGCYVITLFSIGLISHKLKIVFKKREQHRDQNFKAEKSNIKKSLYK